MFFGIYLHFYILFEMIIFILSQVGVTICNNYVLKSIRALEQYMKTKLLYNISHFYSFL